MRRLDLVACFVGAFLFVVSLMATAQSTEGKIVQSGYAPVNGLKMYYEIEGTGEPLVYIPPAFGYAGLTSFPALVERHSVITVDLEGHGRTADIPERPLSIDGRPLVSADPLRQRRDQSNSCRQDDRAQYQLRLAAFASLAASEYGHAHDVQSDAQSHDPVDGMPAAIGQAHSQ